ncbi:flagellar hook-length control protein FliK [Novosphingobium sp. RL4]|uniref:flagellar hook-length control protein FliK n=1 Tax=Novosphingobium sp. RL4 TaxID=3109595 RepID=UPI002D787924|nr:flagellar hook-length control protein FliK [Novosphingobium sp. RL4]WRT92731.1 flagellar hook-length control protein FliK [Novosphingobium sp. RL4]
MPVSMNALFPTSAPAAGAATSADSLAASGQKAPVAFGTLLGATRKTAPAASAMIAGEAAGTGAETVPAADPALAAPAPADAAENGKLVQQPWTAATSLEEAAATPGAALAGKPEQGAKPVAAHKTVADKLVPQAETAKTTLAQLAAQAAASQVPSGTDTAVPADGAAADAPVAEDGSAPDAGDADVDPASLVQTAQVQNMPVPAATQPALAVAPQAVPDVKAEKTEGGAKSGEIGGKSGSKLASRASAADRSAGSADRLAPEPAATRGQGAGPAAMQQADFTPDQSSAQGDGNLSTPLLSQTLTGTAARPAALPYPATQSATQSAAVSVQEGQFGADIGVEIARALDKGSDDLLIRLDPRHMGRIDVRLSFDHEGVLRAVMSADSSSALDMLRRESTDLNRALADAGIRADGQSLRFDSRSGGQGGQRWQGDQQGQRQAQGSLSDTFGGSDDPIYRPLRSSGHVDLMA